MRTSTTVWSEAYLFFFFQAEDGIRDLTVTGVQTLLFRSRELMDLSVTEPTGVGADHISIFSMAIDASRGVIYGLGSPTSHLYPYNIATGQTTDHGRSTLLTRRYYHPGRFMRIDSHGRVFFTLGTAWL